ncbi:MAG: hypothetical protein ACRDJW_18975 [Thermomicrobiales bacterium]
MKSGIPHLGIMVALLMLAVLAHPARAHEATPSAADYPSFTVTNTASGVDLPDSVPGGLVRVTVQNETVESSHIFFYRVPDAISDEQLQRDLANPDAAPAWFEQSFVDHTADVPGTPDHAPPGATARGVIDLEPGRYLVVDPLFDVRRERLFTVTAPAAATSAPSPEPDIEVTMAEMSFTGLEQPLAAGEHVWQITNAGKALHEVAIVPMPAGAPAEEVLAGIEALFTGQPAEIEFAPVAGQGLTAPGRTSWQFIDLAPGTYAAVCMFPDENFVPHAFNGMVQIFTVV